MNKDDSSGEAKRHILQGWEIVAEEYSRDRSGVFGRSARRLIDYLHPTRGSTLLDIGSGTGSVTIEAAENVGSRGWVIGIDIAASMLQLNRSLSMERGQSILHCQMDAERLGFVPSSFDFVTCGFSLFQFPDMETALNEMWRVLKPGGRLGLSNWGPGYFTPIASLQRDLFRKFKLEPLLTNPITIDPSRLKERLNQTGFTNVKLITERDDVWFASPEEVWAYNMDMGPFPIMLRSQLSVEQQNDLYSQFKVMIDDLKTPHGIKSVFHLLFATAEKGI